MPDTKSTPSAADLAQTIMRVLDNWGIEPLQQAALLGMPDGTRARALNRYRQGTSFPEDTATTSRISRLLTIEQALMTSFPHNVTMASYWVTTTNALLQDRTPVQVMLDRGLEGMDQVIGLLNGTDHW